MNFLNLKKTFVIAEIGGNHEGDIEYAKRLLRNAARSGVDAVKFQSYSADGIVSKIEDPQRHKHFERFSLSVKDFIELSDLANKLGVIFMSSVWDSYYLGALNPYIEIHKIGSGDLTNYPLIKEIVQLNKPLIISTAMATMEEVQDTINFIDQISPNFIKKGNLAILQCVAMYGDPNDHYAHLNVIKSYIEKFPEITIGYSDHSLGSHACNIAVSLGAKILEVHFTDDKNRDFRDHHISVDESELKELITSISRTEKMMGVYQKEPIHAIETEQRINEFRRACYFIKDMEKDEVISIKNLTTLRPNKGVDARKYFDLIGKKVLRNIKAGHSFSEEDIET